MFRWRFRGLHWPDEGNLPFTLRKRAGNQTLRSGNDAMTSDSFRAALRVFARRRPFKPFVIEFMTGQELLIKHPEAVSLRGELVVYGSPKGTHRFFDSDSVCQLTDEAGE